MNQEEADVKNILLVEDDEVTNFLSTHALNAAGIHKIDVAENGRLACEHITKKCPDLIFLDISMPVMDGFGFLDFINKTGTCIDVHVVMLTTSVRPADKQRALNFSQVVDYIEKPLDIEKVENVLTKLRA